MGGAELLREAIVNEGKDAFAERLADLVNGFVQETTGDLYLSTRRWLAKEIANFSLDGDCTSLDLLSYYDNDIEYVKELAQVEGYRADVGKEKVAKLLDHKKALCVRLAPIVQVIRRPSAKLNTGRAYARL